MPFYKVDESTAIYGKTMKEAYIEFKTQERFCTKWEAILAKPLGTVIRVEIFREYLSPPKWTVTMRVGLLGVAMRSPINTNLMFCNVQDAIWYLYTFMADAVVKYYVVER